VVNLWTRYIKALRIKNTICILNIMYLSIKRFGAFRLLEIQDIKINEISKKLRIKEYKTHRLSVIASWNRFSKILLKLD